MLLKANSSFFLFKIFGHKLSSNFTELKYLGNVLIKFTDRSTYTKRTLPFPRICYWKMYSMTLNVKILIHNIFIKINFLCEGNKKGIPPYFLLILPKPSKVTWKCTTHNKFDKYNKICLKNDIFSFIFFLY